MWTLHRPELMAVEPAHRQPLGLTAQRMWRAWLCLIGWIEREQLRSSALPGSQVSSFAMHAMHQYHWSPTALADSGRRGAQRSDVKEKAEGQGTRTELSAASS